jgi:hypothetical protein
VAHGSPDWAAQAPKSTLYGLYDMAELAARLGSPVTFDRRGDVVFCDDFTNGLGRWSETGSGYGNDAYPVVYPTRTLGLAISLRTGSGIGDVSGIYREIPYPVLGKIGFETSFVVYAGVSEFLMWIALFTGTALYDYYVSYHHTDGSLYICVPNSEVKIGTPGKVYEDYAHFQTLKLVVDIKANRYERVIFNDHTYLLTAYAPHVAANAGVRRCVARLYVYSAITGCVTAVVDDAIFTQNEP